MMKSTKHVTPLVNPPLLPNTEITHRSTQQGTCHLALHGAQEELLLSNPMSLHSSSFCFVNND